MRRDMVLRARVKNVQDMPPGVPCCERMAVQLLAWGDRELRVLPQQRKKNCNCLACKAKFNGIAVEGIKGWYIDPRAWEIEEAPDASNSATP